MSLVGFLSGGSFSFYLLQGFISSFVLLLVVFYNHHTAPFLKEDPF